MADNHTKETNSLIYGTNNIFEKDYDKLVAELGIKAKVKLHLPSMAETAKVKAEVARVFDGTAASQDYVTQAIYEMLFNIQVLDEGTQVWSINETIGEDGEKIIERTPLDDYFSIDGHASSQFLLAITEDFLEWQNRFRWS